MQDITDLPPDAINVEYTEEGTVRCYETAKSLVTINYRENGTIMCANFHNKVQNG